MELGQLPDPHRSLQAVSWCLSRHSSHLPCQADINGRLGRWAGVRPGSSRCDSPPALQPFRDFPRPSFRKNAGFQKTGNLFP